MNFKKRTFFNGDTGLNNKLPTRGVKHGCSAIKIYSGSSLSSPSTLGSRSLSHELRLLSGGDGTKNPPPPPPERFTSPRDHSRGFQLTSNANAWRFKAIFSRYREYSTDGERGCGSLWVARHSWEETPHPHAPPPESANFNETDPK